MVRPNHCTVGVLQCVNFGFFVGIVDIQVAMGIVIARYCVMGGYLKWF